MKYRFICGIIGYIKENGYTVSEKFIWYSLKSGDKMSEVRYRGNIDCLISNVGFVNVTRERGYKTFFKNGKDINTFIFVVSGGLRYSFSEGIDPMTVTDGMLMFVPKGLEYKAEYIAGASTVKVLTFDCSDNAGNDLLKKPFYVENRRLGELFGAVTQHSGVNSIFLASKLYELIWMLGEMNFDIPEKYSKIATAVQRIEQNYFENVRISEYAEELGMSESNFRKLFKERLGMSPIEYRNLIRIREAQKMILSGECTVQEAAYLA